MIIKKIELDKLVAENGWANISVPITSWLMKVGFDKNGLWIWYADTSNDNLEIILNWHKIEIIKDSGEADDMSTYINSFMKDGILYHAFNTFIVSPTDI